ncbi:MAG: hypothetical protein ACI4VF_06095 [Lachnospirales bacterium]
MNVHCDKCLSNQTPVKANKNPFSLDAKCSKCGENIDLSDSKIMLNIGRVFRIPCYIAIAYIVLTINNHLPQNFEEFLYSLGFIVTAVAVIYGLYCIIGNIFLFLIKGKN